MPSVAFMMTTAALALSLMEIPAASGLVLQKREFMDPPGAPEVGSVCPIADGCAYDADPCAMIFRWDDKATPCGEGQGYYMGPTIGGLATDGPLRNISTGCSVDDPPIYSIVFNGHVSCGTCGDHQTMEFFDDNGASLGDYSFTQGVYGECFSPGVPIKSYAWTQGND